MTGNKTTDLIVSALNLTLVAAGIGVFAWSNFIDSRKLPTDIEGYDKLKDTAKKMVFSETFKLDSFTINLQARHTKLRFLDVEMHMLPFRKEFLELLKENKAMVLDSIIDITGKMEPKDLNSVAGRILLEDKIKRVVNDQLDKQVIKRIFFTKFVIQ
ncbi:MAG: flagellar basal body-associated FliL family protein [Bacteriovoracaceae bacterium]|jgi:flagellar protein FliL|nr:flagellar basal body-associated FliL family protein [Bacteriovoracaceae bacterium]